MIFNYYFANLISIWGITCRESKQLDQDPTPKYYKSDSQRLLNQTGKGTIMQIKKWLKFCSYSPVKFANIGYVSEKWPTF